MTADPSRRRQQIKRLVSRLFEGAAAGVAGTVAMSVPMLAARRLGFSATLPPEVIVGKVTGLPRGAPRSAAATAAHLLFGAGCGSALRLLSPANGSLPGALLRGTATGASVWAASYAGWVPALGLLPPPPSDDRGRQVTVALSHAVFGITAALALSLLDRRRRPAVVAPVAPPDADEARTPLARRDPVDEAIAESFPASDPPSWTVGR